MKNGDFQDKQNIQLLAFPEGVMSISPKYVIGGPKARWRLSAAVAERQRDLPEQVEAAQPPPEA